MDSRDGQGSCSHCQLPLGRSSRLREVNGSNHWFCCYGCYLAFQFHCGSREEPEAALLLIRLGVGGFLAMNIMLFSWLLYAEAFSGSEAWLAALVPWLLWALATPLMIVLGGPFLRGAWEAGLDGQMTADSLVSLGVLAAYAYSAWQTLQGSMHVFFDTVTMVLMLFTLGRYLEAQARVRAARSLAPMLAAERAVAKVLEAAGESERPVEAVRPGDAVVVYPGERLVVDGLVLEGRSECDESFLTGQFDPQPKTVGDRVSAGSLNGDGRLLIRASVQGDETHWVRIGQLVREALARKSLLGEAVDRVAARFLPAVLILSVATLWYWSSRASPDAALMAGLSVLVVACPCALGLAASLATTLGIARAAQRGILIRGPGALERLGRLKGIAFDKTGTLTLGELGLVAMKVAGAVESEVLGVAQALARGSRHPVARAVVACAKARQIGSQPVERLRSQAGSGLMGEIGGVPCALGSSALLAELGWSIPAPLAPSAADPRHSLVYVGWRGRAYGRFDLADMPRAEAGPVVSSLRELGLRLLLLSGDAEAPVARLAETFGIPQWYAGLTPEAKAATVQEWTRHYGPVAMVGDGLNDGPVLAAAPLGIAVGGGTDLAKESADVVLPEDGLTALPWLLGLAAEVRRSVRANLAWAFGYNAIALTLAAAGLLQPVAAAALMAGSSILIVVRTLHGQFQAKMPLDRQVPGICPRRRLSGVLRSAL